MEERRQIATLWINLRTCSHFWCHQTMKPATRAATVARNVVGRAVSPPHINAAINARQGLEHYSSVVHGDGESVVNCKERDESHDESHSCYAAGIPVQRGRARASIKQGMQWSFYHLVKNRRRLSPRVHTGSCWL